MLQYIVVGKFFKSRIINILTGTVTEVLAKPYYQWGKWWVKVKYNCYGRISETELMFQNRDSSLKVDVGFEFDC